MDLPEQRIIGALILLAGISCLAVGLATDQLSVIAEFIEGVLQTAIAG